MGATGGIPITEIAAYCDFHEITDLEERVDFMKIIKMLDDQSVKMNGKKDG